MGNTLKVTYCLLLMNAMLDELVTFNKRVVYDPKKEKAHLDFKWFLKAVNRQLGALSDQERTIVLNFCNKKAALLGVLNA